MTLAQTPLLFPGADTNARARFVGRDESFSWPLDSANILNPCETTFARFLKFLKRADPAQLAPASLTSVSSAASLVVGQFDGASTAIMVAVILTRRRVRLASKTEPSQTVSVRPAWTTFPTAMSRSVFAVFRNGS